MSEEKFEKLTATINKSKVAMEEVITSLENLDRKNAELFVNKQIPYKVYTEINTKISAPAHKIFEESGLSSHLDTIAKLARLRTIAAFFVIEEMLRQGEWVDLLMVLKDMGFSINVLFEKPLPSIDVIKFGIEERPVSKAIDNLLYTYTPYKLRGARRDELSILLVPSLRGDSINRSWFSNEVNYFHEDGIKIVTPDEVRPVRLSELRNIIYVNGEFGFRLEIDNRIGEATFYCGMGQYASPLRNCYRSDCWLWSACNGRRFWSRRPRSFYSLFKVSPNIRVIVDHHSKPEVLADFNNVLTFERINELTAKIYIHSVTFLSRYMIRNPIIRPKETIGYRVNTQSISVAIDAAWLKEFVRKTLKSDQTIYKWIYTKYFISANFDVNDLRRLSRFFWHLITSHEDRRTEMFTQGISSQRIDEELVEFGCRILLHSLAHVVHQEIVALLQTSPDNIIYYFSPRIEDDGKFRIFLFENAERGLGLTQSFSTRIEEGKEKVVADMFMKIIERIGICGMQLAPSINLEEAGANIKTIIEQLDFYNSTLNSNFGIYLPIEISRYILAREDNTTRGLIDREDISTFIDDILSTIPLCWDGCYQCVRLENDCHETPYEQMFHVSKLLLVSLLNEWSKLFTRLERPEQPSSLLPTTKTFIEIGEARRLFDYIMDAAKIVRVTSPWISKEVAESICGLAKERKIQFQIITSLDLKVESHKKALKTLLDKGFPNVQVRVLKDRMLHAKMVIIDDSLLIIGSANLTLSGLYENVECYAVLSATDVTQKSLNKFIELWNSATPIHEIKKLIEE
ncbi:MAG: phospholipase D family protein [Nitrososphaerota archaeon]